MFGQERESYCSHTALELLLVARVYKIQRLPCNVTVQLEALRKETFAMRLNHISWYHATYYTFLRVLYQTVGTVTGGRM